MIIIRADASTEIGTGHVMRCLALAQACKQVGHEPLFLLAADAKGIEDRLLIEGMEVVHLSSAPGSSEDAEETLSIIQKRDAEWITLDGYQFDAAYQETLQKSGVPFLCIDDYSHLDRYAADVILNQNISASETLYNGKTTAKLLLGPSNALLRQEFLEQGSHKKEIPEIAQNILVTLGGADPDNVTLMMLSVLNTINHKGLEVLLLCGGANPHEDALRDAAAKSPHHVTVETNVTDMPARMAWADVAIAAGGSTSWEFLFMGVPFVTGILAENQEGIASGLGEQGLATNCGWYKECAEAELSAKVQELLKNASLRKEMSALGQNTVDGKGAERVIQMMESFST